jgi:hypothetical protein
MRAKEVKVFALVNTWVGKAKGVLSKPEKAGLGLYPLLGEYDYMAIYEIPTPVCLIYRFIRQHRMYKYYFHQNMLKFNR